jgi:integrase
MSQPWQHPETGVWYFRGRVPADLQERLIGQKLSLRVAGHDRTVTLGPILKVSLSTKDRAEAKVRHAAVQSQLQDRWATARRVAAITHEEINGIAARAYRDLVSEFRADPGRADGWEAYEDQLIEPLQYLDEESDGVTSEPFDPKHAARELSKLIDLDRMIGVSGLALDSATRLKLLVAIAEAQLDAVRTLRRFADGDYRDDKSSARYADAPSPPAPAVKPSSKPNGRTASALGGFEVLLAGWEHEKLPKQATSDLWRVYIAEFIAFIGHNDPKLVRRPDVNAWKAKMLADGLSHKTINDSKLAALKAILGWAVDNDLLTENAAARVSVKSKSKPGQRMRDPEPEDAAVILRAASQEQSPVYRWVPLLCAASGARVAEVCQLRAEDISEVGGISVMHIRAAAGSVKNSQSERTVPLHPEVLRAGFLAFVAKKKTGPLFYDPSRRRVGARKPPAKIVAKNVAAWTRKLGLKIGRAEHRIDPNHGLRHLFKTLARDAGVGDSVIDAIMGQGPKTVAQGYGRVWVSTANRAIASVELPGLSADVPKQKPEAPPIAPVSAGT